MAEGAQDEQNRDEDPATTPFARFEDLVRKVVYVPKEALDAMRGEDERKMKEKRPDED